MNRRMGLTVMVFVAFSAAGSRRAEAGDRFSFGLSIWGPPPVHFGPGCCHDHYYFAPPPPPPPVVYRRVVVVPPSERVVVAPAPARRAKQPDLILEKIGELHSDDEDVREDAAQWLGDARSPRAVRPLIEAMRNDPENDVREEAARALGLIGGREAEQALSVAAASDPDKDVRRAATKALSRMAKESTKNIVR